MSDLQRIAVLNSKLEAERLDTELAGKDIAHLMVSYHESAFDGLFQMGRGWGHVEAEPQHQEEILAVLEALRQASTQTQGAGAVSPAEPAQAEDKSPVPLDPSLRRTRWRWSAWTVWCSSFARLCNRVVVLV